MKTILTLLFLTACTFFSFKLPPVREPFMMVFIEHKNTSEGNADGSVNISVSGGVAPYQLLLVSVPLAHTKVFATGEKIEATGLKAGKYQIHITDQKSLSYVNEVIVE